MWQASDLATFGVQALGYNTMEELWMDYTVFALVRNPYERAGSSFDYLLSRRKKVRCSLSLLVVWLPRSEQRSLTDQLSCHEDAAVAALLSRPCFKLTD
jgi:hypothetical protein